MKLTIVNNSGRPVARRFLERWVRGITRELSREKPARAGILGRELVVAFVSVKEGRRLNRQYRQRDYPTDVLSFESVEAGVLGELVICPEVISRQAREHGLLVREELGYMVLHGVLHLLGFDHERGAREAKRMLDLQDKIFEKLRG